VRHKTDLSERAVRPATAADRRAIRTIVRASGINPLGLHWSRFLVAEYRSRIVGTGQIKPHGDGSRELASIAVVPEWQGQGIATEIIHALLAREPGTLYLVCRPELGELYARFGFRPASGAGLPNYFRRLQRLVELLGRLARLVRLPAPQMLVMHRQGP
jgi:N-acetylglutamate synthase-like GNAT family acetyltransferase